MAFKHNGYYSDFKQGNYPIVRSSTGKPGEQGPSPISGIERAGLFDLSSVAFLRAERGMVFTGGGRRGGGEMLVEVYKQHCMLSTGECPTCCHRVYADRTDSRLGASWSGSQSPWLTELQLSLPLPAGKQAMFKYSSQC